MRGTQRVGTVIVVGLRAEALLARRLGVPVVIGGGTAAGAEAAARRAVVAAGATALVSFGLAGGLDPGLRPGALVVPTAVLCGDRSFAADPALMAMARRRDDASPAGGRHARHGRGNQAPAMAGDRRGHAGPGERCRGARRRRRTGCRSPCCA